jgi:hypothetical protein
MLDFIFKPLGMGGMPGWGKTGMGIGGGLLLLLLLSQLFGKRGSLEDYDDDERRQAQDLMDRMMKRATGQQKHAGLFYRNTEPTGIGMMNKSAPSPGDMDMFSMIERHREPRLLTKLWDNPDLFEEEEEHLRPLIAAQALMPQKRYRKIQPERTAMMAAMLNDDENLVVPPDVKEELMEWLDAQEGLEEDPKAKAASYASAPRFSRSAKGSKPDGKYLPGHKYQGSSTKPIPRTRTTGMDARINKIAGFSAFHELTKYAEIGPYDVQQSADVANYDDVIAGLERNRKEKPLHYWLNPFVGGPIRELGARYLRRASAGTIENWPGAILSPLTLGIAPALMGGRKAKMQARDIYHDYASPYSQEEDDEATLEDRQGPKLGDEAEADLASEAAAKEAAYEGEQTGPFSGQQAAIMSGLDKSIAGTEYNRRNHPLHYWLNPFVPGPISELVSRFSRRHATGTGRNLAGAAMGSTLPAVGRVAGSASGVPLGAGLGMMLGMSPTAAMGGVETRDKARKAHEAVNILYHEADEDRETEARLQERRKKRREEIAQRRNARRDSPGEEQKAAAFAFTEKIAMQPLMVMNIRRQMVISGKPKKAGRAKSVKPGDNKTPSTTDMAKSKDQKGAFTVT